MGRLTKWWESLAAAARGAGDRLATLARDPLRILPILTVIALLAVSVPLLVTGLVRVGRSSMDWRASSAIHWQRAESEVTRIRIDDGLVVHVAFDDRQDRAHQADVFVGDAGGHWIGRRVPIRYDRAHPDRVEIVGLHAGDPVLGLLRAGAPLGTGTAGLIIAVALWRRRRLVEVSAHPLRVLVQPLVIAGGVLAVGIVAWALGTVWERGWSAVAGSIGHVVGTIFGDLLGVLVPLVAFALGCLVTAWLARYRHHADDHDDVFSSAHRFIDRAAGMVPSPDELRARPGAANHETQPEPEERASPVG